MSERTRVISEEGRMNDRTRVISEEGRMSERTRVISEVAEATGRLDRQKGWMKFHSRGARAGTNGT